MGTRDVNGRIINAIVTSNILGPFRANCFFTILHLVTIVFMLSLLPVPASSSFFPSTTVFAWTTIRRATTTTTRSNFVRVRNARQSSEDHHRRHSFRLFGKKVEGNHNNNNSVTGISNTNMYYLDSVKSTQEEAKRFLKEGISNDNDNDDTIQRRNGCWGVTAKKQTNGKGTSGREWKGADGNCFLTIALPCSSVPFPFTLLPLFVGNAVAHTISSSFSTSQKKTSVSVKWPNDVLICDKKVAGVLIECDMSHFLIGIGINVAHAPTISSQGSHRGRPSTCLHDYIFPNDSDSDDRTEEGVELSKQLATDITSYISKSISITTQEQIISTWSQYAENGNFFDKPSLLRDELRFQSYVRPLSIQPDGQLRVRDEQTGKERLLCADYLL